MSNAAQYETEIEEKEVLIRSLTPFWSKVVLFASASTSLFIIWINTFGTMRELWRNSLTWSLLAFIGFLLYPMLRRGSEKIKFPIDIFIALFAISITIYLVVFEDSLHSRNEDMITSDFIYAIFAIALTIELSRRTTGWIIPGIALSFIGYVMWFGAYLPGIFHFTGLSWERLLYRLFYTDEGIFGTIATISSTYVFMFIIFAAFLLKSGSGDFIMKLSQAVTGRITGGPGLVAVVSSGLMGTISGAAISNVVSTGSITIPMMKRAGFLPKYAAAIETAASTGGQIMPPIMGAGAFIMAEYTNIPYTQIIAVSFLPAILYFFSVGIYVYFRAKYRRLQPIEIEGGNKITWALLKDGIQFIIPIVLLITLLIIGFTPTYAAGISSLAIIVTSWFTSQYRMGPKAIIEALALGSRNMVTTGVLLVTVGIVVGIISMTSLSVTFAQMITQWSGGSLLFALLLVTLASLLLGMGLPVTAAYIILAVLAAPALTKLGISLLVAHLFILWVSQDSNVTPPVCLAAYAAAGIAGSKPMATGITAWNLSKGLYIIPLLMVYTGLIEGTWFERFEEFFFALFGFTTFAAAMVGYFAKRINYLERFILIAITVGLFAQTYWLQIVCLIISIVLFLFFRWQAKKNPEIA